MPIPNYIHQIKTDIKKAKIIDGKIHLPTEIGWDIIYDIDFPTSVQKYNYDSKEPLIYSDLVIKGIKLNQKEKAMTQEQIEKYLTDKSITGMFDYDDVMIGFVYSTPQDIMNYTWMLQFRNSQKNIINVFNSDAIDIDCNFSFESWYDTIWHCRVLIQHDDIESIMEVSKGHIIVKGKNLVGMDGDISLIKEDVDKIRLRCNVKLNIWYMDFLDSNNKTCQSTLSFPKISGSIPLKSHTDFSKTKPWVSYMIDPKDIGHIMKVGDTLSIYRKKYSHNG